MRYVFFDEYRPGVLHEGRVHDLSALLADSGAHTPQEALEYLIANERLLRPSVRQALAIGEGRPLAEVRLRPPVPRPSKILCALANYRGGPRDGLPPDFTLKSPAAIVGPGDTVRLPPLEAEGFLHEAELALVIGRRASKVGADEALAYVFGYVPFLDVTAHRVAGNTDWAQFYSKSYDTFAPLGPALVTADEVADPHALRVRLTVNGHPRQDFTTAAMVNPLPALIAAASRVTTLEPGDLIATGTNPQGLGPLRDGDEVALTIDGLGTLTVHVRGSAEC